MPTRKPASHADVVQAIKEHENVMHTALHAQINTLDGKISSLTHDHNKSVKAIRDTQTEIVNSIRSMSGMVDAWNSAGWLKRTIIEIGKLVIAISAISGAVWAALHFGSKP